MAINHRYPYTDIHDLNLDWILRKMKELEVDFDEFKVVNNITFSGTWDITKQYPAWTIVSDNNIGYVSQQPVPAGVPLSNGSYWVEVIDYTAQIAGLENRVIALEGDMITVQNDIINIQDDILKMTMAGRTFLFVGDSYASQSATWVTPCVNAAGIVNYTNEAVTGTAFYDGTFKSQIENFTGNRDDVTDIVVGGGLNDSIFNTVGTDYNACKNAIADFATYAKANYPNAKLWLAFMGNAIDDAALLSGRTWDKRNWAKWTYETIGRDNGFTIIKGCNEALGVSVQNFNADHIHPNSTGANVIGNCVANAITGSEKIACYPYYQTGMSAVGNNVIRNTAKMNYSFDNGMFNIDLSDSFAIEIGTDYPTFSASTSVDLVTLTSVYFNKKITVPVEGRLDGYNSKSFANVPMVLEFYQNKVSARLDTINAAGNGFESYTTATPTAAVAIQRGIQFSVPAMYIN